MTKSDRNRIEDALTRWEDRYRATRGSGTCAEGFAAAVDWFRAEVKLAHTMLDPDREEWADHYVCDLTVIIAGAATELRDEIREEAKKL